MDKELRLALVKVNKLILSGNYEESLKLIENLLKEPLDDIVLSELYNQKAKCLFNLNNYRDALLYLNRINWMNII